MESMYYCGRDICFKERTFFSLFSKRLPGIFRKIRNTFSLEGISFFLLICFVELTTTTYLLTLQLL